jgi:hypothetical protein
MKLPLVKLLVALTFSLLLIWPTSMSGIPQSEGRYSLRTLGFYHPNRIGYESLPVKILGAGGGKLGPHEKFKIFASGFKNEAAKNIKAIRFSYFIFNSDNLDVAIDTGHSDLIPFDLPALERRMVRVHVVNVDDVPSLAYKQGQEFHLEVAVTEVHYDDGSIWRAADVPGKMNHDKEP